MDLKGLERDRFYVKVSDISVGEEHSKLKVNIK